MNLQTMNIHSVILVLDIKFSYVETSLCFRTYKYPYKLHVCISNVLFLINLIWVFNLCLKILWFRDCILYPNSHLAIFLVCNNRKDWASISKADGKRCLLTKQEQWDSTWIGQPMCSRWSQLSLLISTVFDVTLCHLYDKYIHTYIYSNLCYILQLSLKPFCNIVQMLKYLAYIFT